MLVKALETVTMPDGFKNKSSQPNSQKKKKKRIADIGAEFPGLREEQTVPGSPFQVSTTGIQNQPQDSKHLQT